MGNRQIETLTSKSSTAKNVKNGGSSQVCSALDKYTFGECSMPSSDINYNTIDLNPTKSSCKGSLFLPAVDMSGGTVKCQNIKEKNCLPNNKVPCMWY